jgi:hypothetical protein
MTTTALRLPDLLKARRRSRRWLAKIGGLHVAAEISRIDFRHLAFAADHATAQLGCHRFAKLMEQHESRLVGNAKIAREGERRLALDLVTEDGDGREIGFERQLVRGEQRPGRDAELLAACTAFKLPASWPSRPLVWA